MIPANDNNPHWPRGLSRDLAAKYIGVSLGIFDRAVRDGLMPKSKRIYNRILWDRHQLDISFDLLDGVKATTIARPNGWEFAA